MKITVDINDTVRLGELLMQKSAVAPTAPAPTVPPASTPPAQPGFFDGVQRAGSNLLDNISAGDYGDFNWGGAALGGIGGLLARWLMGDRGNGGYLAYALAGAGLGAGGQALWNAYNRGNQQQQAQEAASNVQMQKNFDAARQARSTYKPRAGGVPITNFPRIDPATGAPVPRRNPMIRQDAPGTQHKVVQTSPGAFRKMGGDTTLAAQTAARSTLVPYRAPNTLNGPWGSRIAQGMAAARARAQGLTGPAFESAVQQQLPQDPGGIAIQRAEAASRMAARKRQLQIPSKQTYNRNPGFMDRALASIRGLF